MALNWSGQNSGTSTGPNLTSLYQQNQQPQGMTTGTWRPSTTGATGISGIGGSRIGLSRPQMSPAPPMYPQMSSAYPTSKGGTPLYNRDVQQQEQDWLNQNSGTQWQPGPGATVPYPQQLPPGATGVDGLGNPTYPQMHDNRPSGGGGGQGGIPGRDDAGSGPTYGGVGMTPGPAGHQGAQQDYYDPVTGQMIYGNQQATGWQAPYSGMNSGEGGTSGVGGGGGMGMPFTQAEYMAMKPEQQAAANNYMATQMPYMQYGQNAYQYERDANQAAGQWGLTFAQQVENDAWNRQFAQQQLGYGREDAAAQQGNWNRQMAYEEGMGNRQMSLQERQAIQEQQRWGADHVLRQSDQQFGQGMQTRQFAEDTRRYDQGFGEDSRRYNQDFGLRQRGQEQQYGLDAGRLQSDTQRWQGDQGIARQGQLNELDMFGRNLGENQRQFNMGQNNEMDRFGRTLGQQQHEFGATLGQQQHEFNAQMGLQNRQFGEDTRRYDQGFGEDTRRYNQDFGEDARRYNQDFGFKQTQFGEDTRRFDVGQGNWQSEFGEDTRRFDAGQAQQMAIENMRLAQAERAANVAATGRALAPNARWLRQS
jgi:hypothetical protein